MKIASVKGMKDVLPGLSGEEAAFDSRAWEKLEAVVREVFRRYAFDRVHTPVVELAELFARGVGEGTDVVGKEMYTFPERGGDRLLALRPEGTAGVVRAYIEHGLAQSDPVQRLWYLGPMFRHERQQKHRYRQFFQFGVEFLGVGAPEADVEVLALGRDVLAGLGLAGIELRLNSLGDATCRPAYLEALRAFLRGKAAELCGDCRERTEKNPLRVLDCKVPGCREATRQAPVSHEHLCGPCAEHFARVRAGIERLGIEYRLDGRLVRGLDYYTRTAFEYEATALGSGQQTAAGGGGRYDGLVKLLGGPDTPAIGFAMGVERLVFMMGVSAAAGPLLFLGSMDETGRDRALELAWQVRAAGFSAELDLRGGKVQKQAARADRRGARYLLVVGASELASGLARLKDMRDGSEEVRLSDLTAELRRRAGGP